MRNALSWESFASAERDDEAGQVLTAGWGANGQLGVGDRASRVVPHALRFSSAVVQVACGSSVSAGGSIMYLSGLPARMLTSIGAASATQGAHASVRERGMSRNDGTAPSEG